MAFQSALPTGLSGFLLTPHHGGVIDHDTLTSLSITAVHSGVDSIGAIGSTGGYAYLDRRERRDAARTVINAVGKTPVIVGVGACSTRAVLQHVDDAMTSGAAGVMLAPLAYQSLGDEEVFGLFADVAAATDAPVVVYDNPATTGFTFTGHMLARIAQLPGIASIKLSELPVDADRAQTEVAWLRERIPATVTLGISGDGAAARGLLAGCDTWFSVIGGTLPGHARHIADAALRGERDEALSASAHLDSIWELFDRFGSFRVTAAIATLTGRTESDAVFSPVQGLSGDARDAVRSALVGAEIPLGY